MELGFGHLLFLIYCIGYYTLHSLMASNMMKSIIKLYPQKYRLLFNFIAIITILPGIPLFKSMERGTYSMPAIVLVIMGVILALIGLGIILVALLNYDLKEFTGLGKVKQNEELRINGLNKYVRHPLYTGTFLLVWGLYLGKMEGNFLIIALVTSVYIYLGTMLEERKLIAEFGEDYLAYKKQVPMFFPKLF